MLLMNSLSFSKILTTKDLNDAAMLMRNFILKGFESLKIIKSFGLLY